MTMKAPTKRPTRNKNSETISSKDEITQNSQESIPELEVKSKPELKIKRKTNKQKIEEEIANAKLIYEGPPYVLHEIECLCFSRVQKAMAHDAHGRRIDVFSLVDDEGNIVPSTIQCEDCGRKWDILDLDDYDLAQMDKMPTYTRKKLQRTLPKDLVHVCDEWKVETALMAYISWVIEKEKWGTQILINKKKYRREDISFETRILEINGPLNFKIKEMQASNIAELW